METAQVRQRTELLSAGDSQVAAALELLEARLQEWLSALRDGQKLIDAAALWEAAQATLAEQEAAAQAEASGPRAGRTDHVASGPRAGRTDDVASGPRAETDEAAPELSDHAEAPPAETKPEPHIPKVTAASEPPAAEAAETPAVPAEAAAGESDEDQALLASLDPELAAAIRVKRRLGHKKSVRELLADLEKQSAKSRSGRRGKDGKKWWR